MNNQNMGQHIFILLILQALTIGIIRVYNVHMIIDYVQFF